MSIRRIPGLREIQRDKKGFTIGAAATLSEVAEHPEIRNYYPGLVHAIETIASPQIRNRGTIGGNICLETKCLFLDRGIEARRSKPECLKEGGEICNIVTGAKRCFSIFSADCVPVLIALGAKVKILGVSERKVVPIQDVYSGNGEKPLKLDKEILTHVLVPFSTVFCVYLKARWRRSLDFPIAGLAMAITVDRNGKKCKDLRIVLTGVTSFPVRAKEAELVFKGDDITAMRDNERLGDAAKQALKASHPISPMGGLGAYRRALVKVLLERAACQLADQIEKQGR